jgi:outer membrane lipoprotein carrier protein
LIAPGPFGLGAWRRLAAAMLSAAAVALALVAAPARAQSDPADPVLSQPGPITGLEANRVWEAYANRWKATDDYQARFRQRISVAGTGSELESAGAFWFSKPDLVAWDYQDGPPQKVVGDGSFLWVYQPDLEQAYKVDYETAFGTGGLVSLLAGHEGVSQRYETSVADAGGGRLRIHLLPLVREAATIDVIVDSETFDLAAVDVTDASGSVTHMDFDDVRRNVGVDADRFRFTPPAGTDVVTGVLQGGGF